MLLKARTIKTSFKHFHIVSVLLNIQKGTEYEIQLNELAFEFSQCTLLTPIKIQPIN